MMMRILKVRIYVTDEDGVSLYFHTFFKEKVVKAKIPTILLSAVLLLSIPGTALADKPFFEESEPFVNEGRANYRIPSLVIAKDGTIIAFANRRIDTILDGAPEKDLVLRRSMDKGKTWLPIQELVAR